MAAIVKDPTRVRCHATSRSTGKPCGRYAISGGTVCYWHGGNTPQARAKATERIAAAEALTVAQRLVADSDEPHRDPVEHLRHLLRVAAVVERVLAAEVADLPQIVEVGAVGWQPHVLVKMWDDARDRQAALAATARKLGLEERLVEAEETQGRQFAAAIRQILDGLDLTETQRGLAPAVVRQAMIAASSGVGR